MNNFLTTFHSVRAHTGELIGQYVPTWSKLRPIGQSKLTASAYTLLVIVPVVARVLWLVESPLELEVFGREVALSLELPFNWKLLYLSAVAGTVGRLMFGWRCPALVTLYSNHDQFQKDGASMSVLKEALLRSIDICSPRAERIAFTFSQDYLRSQNPVPEGLVGEGGFDEFLDHVRDSDIDKKVDCYHFVRRVADDSRPWSRFACTLCFFIAGTAAGIIAFDSTLWVATA